MAEYGYAYKSVSTYSTTNSVRNETRKPVIQQPFVPSVPKTTDHGYSDGHVTRKTIVPVTSSRPYDHSAPPSPLRGSPRKVDDFPSPTKLHNDTNPPQRFSPAANPTGWRNTPLAYNGGEGHKPVGSAGTINNHDGYGSDYGGNKEGPRKPIIGSTIRNNDKYDGHNGTNCYGSDYGSMKGHVYDQGRKPIGSANHDGYDGHGSNGYGGHADYGGHKEGRKPMESTIRNDNYDAHNGYGSDYGSKKGPKPIASTIRNDNYDGYNGTNGNGYGDYNSNKEGHKPIGGTIRNDNHGGYYNGTNNGYGGDKEGRKPIGSSTKIDNYQYDGPNGYGGYGGHDDDHDHYNKKEGYKPISNPNYNNGYGISNGNNREGHGHGLMHKPIGPKISSAWTAAPRRGTQLSEPTNDIEKALELLRMEAAKREHMHNINNNDDDYEYQYDHGPTPTPLANWAAPSGPGYNRKPTGGSPQHGSPRVSNKFRNSQLHMSPTATLIDGRLDYGDEYGHVPVIDSREAAKKFKGSRV